MAPPCELVKTGRTWYEELNSHVEREGFPATVKDLPVSVQIPGTGELRCLGVLSGPFCWHRPWEGTRQAFERYEHEVWYHRPGDSFLASQGRTRTSMLERTTRIENQLDTHTLMVALEALVGSTRMSILDSSIIGPPSSYKRRCP